MTTPELVEQTNSGVGLATFVKNGLSVESSVSHSLLSADDLAHLPKPTERWTHYPRIIQVTTLSDPVISIFNFHGVPDGGKKDTPERDLQTKRLLEKLEGIKIPKILAGDFNMNLDIESMKKLEGNLHNVLRETDFTTTRSSYYKKEVKCPSQITSLCLLK